MGTNGPVQVQVAPGVVALVRGWLHGNSVRLDGPAPALIDAGYHTGAGALLDWLDRAGAAPRDVVLTHVHSDHAGGVAAVVARHGSAVWASASAAAIVARWDPRGLWLGSSGQEMPRFEVDRTFTHGDVLAVGGRRLEVVGTPGHMGCAVALFEPAAGVLVTGDALWERGLGLLDPWLEGEGCFEAASLALDRLEALRGVEVVVPGHGRPFADLHGAIAVARARLAAIAAAPERLRTAIAASGAGFLALARPDLGPAGIREAVRRLVVAHPPRTEGEPDVEAVVQAALARAGA